MREEQWRDLGAVAIAEEADRVEPSVEACGEGLYYQRAGSVNENDNPPSVLNDNDAGLSWLSCNLQIAKSLNGLGNSVGRLQNSRRFIFLDRSVSIPKLIKCIKTCNREEKTS